MRVFVFAILAIHKCWVDSVLANNFLLFCLIRFQLPEPKDPRPQHTASKAPAKKGAAATKKAAAGKKGKK